MTSDIYNLIPWFSLKAHTQNELQVCLLSRSKLSSLEMTLKSSF